MFHVEHQFELDILNFLAMKGVPRGTTSMVLSGLVASCWSGLSSNSLDRDRHWCSPKVLALALATFHVEHVKNHSSQVQRLLACSFSVLSRLRAH